ncbi:hypothetical protein VTK73DRAFT_5324 [Phialemonium thermophilum]|uniref:Uncharacterized protein n=1 Tax=Phialemonium thermophilum TaxID=223376 RepID=A0ABR3Y8S6_9PEZI
MPTPPSSACADVRSPAPSLASAKEQVQDDMALASGNEPRSFPRETKNFDFVVSRSADGYSDINYKSVTLSRLAQCLGQGSWITRTVELRVEPNTIGLSEPQSEVKVAALWGFAGMMEPPSTLRQRYTKPCLRSVEPYSAHASAHLGTTSPIVEADSVIKPIDSKRGPVSMTNTYNSKAWKAPTEWASNLTKASESMICGIPSSTDREQEDPANLNLGSMLREIKKMATATPEIALFRLREDWETVEDPVLRKELEMEKKRWMLSVIFRADIMGKSENHPLEKMKILFLFEPRAVATFLAALYHDCEITDISPAPLSQKMYPNVRPVIKPMLPHLWRPQWDLECADGSTNVYFFRLNEDSGAHARPL